MSEIQLRVEYKAQNLHSKRNDNIRSGVAIIKLDNKSEPDSRSWVMGALRYTGHVKENELITGIEWTTIPTVKWNYLVDCQIGNLVREDKIVTFDHKLPEDYNQRYERVRSKLTQNGVISVGSPLGSPLIIHKIEGPLANWEVALVEMPEEAIGFSVAELTLDEAIKALYDINKDFRNKELELEEVTQKKTEVYEQKVELLRQRSELLKQIKKYIPN